MTVWIRVLCSAVVATVLVFSCTTFGTPKRLSTQEQEAENLIGQAEAASFIQSQVILFAPQLQRKCQQTADRLLAAAGSDRKCRVHIVNSPVVRAFTLPAGDIFLYTGLLDELKNIDELAAVLGHELSHYLHHDATNLLSKKIAAQKTAAGVTGIAGSVASSAARHVISGALRESISPTSIKRTGPRGLPIYEVTTVDRSRMLGFVASEQAIGMFILPRAVGAMSRPMAESLSEILNTGYGEAYERRADKDAVDYAQRAGFDPGAAAEVLTRMQEMSRRQKELLKTD